MHHEIFFSLFINLKNYHWSSCIRIDYEIDMWYDEKEFENSNRTSSSILKHDWEVSNLLEFEQKTCLSLEHHEYYLKIFFIVSKQTYWTTWFYFQFRLPSSSWKELFYKSKQECRAWWSERERESEVYFVWGWKINFRWHLRVTLFCHELRLAILVRAHSMLERICYIIKDVNRIL